MKVSRERRYIAIEGKNCCDERKLVTERKGTPLVVQQVEKVSLGEPETQLLNSVPWLRPHAFTYPNLIRSREYRKVSANYPFTWVMSVSSLITYNTLYLLDSQLSISNIFIMEIEKRELFKGGGGAD